MADSIVDEAVAAIRRRFGGTFRVGLFLGTGLGNLTSEMAISAEILYEHVPHFPRSTAMAHRGELLFGELAGVSVVAMAGRCHLYEGYSPADLMLPVRVLHALGIELLIVTNAAGGLNPSFSVGDVMVVEDHIDLMFPRAGQPQGGDRESAGRAVGRRRFYDAALIDESLAAGLRHNLPLQRGVYVGVKGPNYETRSEYRAFRRIGGDVVGMSTIPEVLCAASLGLRVLALSTVTNVARPDAPQTITPEEVVAMAGRAEPKVRAIVLSIVGGLSDGPAAD